MSKDTTTKQATQAYVSVISHHHEAIIEKLGSLKRLAQHPSITVILRNNVPRSEGDNQDTASAASKDTRPTDTVNQANASHQVLANYCQQHGIEYVINERPQGFAANNNDNFLHAQSLGMQSRDMFIVLNPDVHINGPTIRQMMDCIAFRDGIELANHSGDGCPNEPHHQAPIELATVNLFLNSKRSVFDDNLRRYPNLLNFARNYLLRDRSTVVDKSHPVAAGERFWASAAFLLCRASLYQQLCGFDERYYMYCEDIDFCLRAEQLGYPVEFLPKLSAIHYRRRHSQRFMSKAFRQHLHSVWLFSLAKRGWATMKSRLPALAGDPVACHSAETHNQSEQSKYRLKSAVDPKAPAQGRARPKTELSAAQASVLK
ncbi:MULTISPECIES: hypothetical protein [unclassified Vibrio]|uniref:Glycosyl transferase family 2 n=1 Tax=Vibrio sp. HB236076 TaxID=3232307 RepID=A0AB39HGQ5_9VIBR|nr:hypothetical protein [Vibrio sp. HB161653]MDP5254353.1 hypothetical protein [Vibrio sp. HB161653]